jgi:hypothetical protein
MTVVVLVIVLVTESIVAGVDTSTIVSVVVTISTSVAVIVVVCASTLVGVTVSVGVEASLLGTVVDSLVVATL